MRYLLAMLIFLIGVLPGSSALAEKKAQPWELDVEHSTIGFRIQHIVGYIPGIFAKFSGQVEFDPNAVEKARFYFLIDSASIHTGIPKRDEHLRSPDFLDAAQAPRIIFDSKKVVAGEDGNLTVIGDLTIKDVTAEVQVPVRVLGIKKHPFEKDMPNTQVLGLLAEFSINRVAFHVGTAKWTEMGIMGETIDLVIDMELLQRD